MMFALLSLHLIVGVAIVASGRRLGRNAFAVAALAPAATIVWAISRASDALDGEASFETFAWVERLDIAIDLRLDAFSLVMVVLVSGIGVLVCLYALGYFAPHHPSEPAKPGVERLAGMMTLFAGAMLGVVLSDHLIALFVFWEITSITSYLLIGNDDTNPRARAAALQAILITGMGGLFLFAGLVVIGQAAGTYRLSELITDPPSGSVVNVGLICVLIGAFTKSAQSPFSSWLPGAMIAPTPVSAYLHSATMVKAGVYLVARLSPMFATEGSWRVVVLVAGSVTMIVGGLRAMRQHDLKLLLAYGTISQLGFLMLLFGTGDDHIAQAGVVLLLAHAAFKAALFMVVGMVDHQVGTRDVRELHGFGRSWWPTLVVGTLAAASMAGVPPLFGFISKEKALEGYVVHGEFVGSGVVLAVIVVGSIFTFAYSARFVLGLFGVFAEPGHADVSREAHAPSRTFLAPALVLTVATVAFGLVPALVDRLVEAATIALDPGAEPSRLHLWAGFTVPFALSLVVIGGGGVLVLVRRRVEAVQEGASAALGPVPSAERGFNIALRATAGVARRETAIVQSGSLPIYVAVIVLVVTLVPSTGFITEFDSLPEFVETRSQVAIMAMVVAAAIGATIVRRRIAGALMLGAVGYGMAAFYITEGAPDLALTQFAIETLSTVLFVLVLRFLPATWAKRPFAIGRPLRVAVAGVVGAAVFVFALVASDARSDVEGPQQSAVMVENALEKGKGHNVVNVILVDFRGWDTMGEITVLLVAAVGAVSLARSGRRRDDGGPTFEEILDDPAPDSGVVADIRSDTHSPSEVIR